MRIHNFPVTRSSFFVPKGQYCSISSTSNDLTSQFHMLCIYTYIYIHLYGLYVTIPNPKRFSQICIEETIHSCRQAQGRLQEAEALYRQGLEDCQAPARNHPQKYHFDGCKRNIYIPSPVMVGVWRLPTFIRIGGTIFTHTTFRFDFLLIHNKHRGIKPKEAGIFIPQMATNFDRTPFFTR